MMGFQIFDDIVWIIFFRPQQVLMHLSLYLSLVRLSCRVGSTRGTYLKGPVTGRQSVSQSAGRQRLSCFVGVANGFASELPL